MPRQRSHIQAMSSQLNASRRPKLRAARGEIGGAPKRALYDRAHVPFQERRMHPVGVYAHGSQIIIHAVHPVTGQP